MQQRNSLGEELHSCSSSTALLPAKLSTHAYCRGGSVVTVSLGGRRAEAGAVQKHQPFCRYGRKGKPCWRGIQLMLEREGYNN